ncbi:MAG: hypothetical protein AAF466_14555, partial [Bacteroidota bacterium]
MFFTEIIRAKDSSFFAAVVVANKKASETPMLFLNGTWFLFLIGFVMDESNSSSTGVVHVLKTF